jgi:repressor LexA
MSEMKIALKVKYINSISQWLKALEKRGLISRKLNQHRGIYLTNHNGGKNSFTTIIPVLSSVGCDNLQVLADHNYSDFLTVDNSYIAKAHDDVVAFKAVGDSMVDAEIENGDYVLTEVTDDIKSGDLVVANVEDMAVVKRLKFTANAAILNPESKIENYKPIIMKDNSRIFGKVLDIIRMSPKDDEMTYEYIGENNF